MSNLLLARIRGAAVGRLRRPMNLGRARAATYFSPPEPEQGSIYGSAARTLGVLAHGESLRTPNIKHYNRELSVHATNYKQQSAKH